MDITTEQAFERLTRWQQAGTTLGSYLSSPGAVVGLAMLAQIAEISVRIVLTSESTVLCFSLDKARFQFGPLSVLSLPSKLGPAVALTHLPGGLLAADGLHIRLESGFVLFLCESPEFGQHWLNSAASFLGQPELGGVLKP